MSLLDHGGRLNRAAARYRRPRGEWLDLSTGISPWSYPVPNLPATAWQRLPEPDDGLEAIAAAYYGCQYLLPVAGSQAAIQALPQLRAPCRVGVPVVGYAEHEAAWRAASHQVHPYSPEALETQLGQLDVVVVINPNNPGGERFEPAQLLGWQRHLARRGGWLVVDEAFMDTTPERSLARESHRPGLVVLRSVGKFFGLAGLRAGFVAAEPPLLTDLDRRLGPWALSGPARALCRHALADHHWQRRQRRRLAGAEKRLQALLETRLGSTGQGTALFRTLHHPAAAGLHRALAERGILTRLFADTQLIRLGLPGAHAQWRRLDQALAALSPNFHLHPESVHDRP